MWISKQMANRSKPDNIALGEISENAGANVSVLEDFEHKNVKIAAPYGIFYKSPLSQKCVLLQSDDENVCAGVIMGNKNLSVGDLLLCTSNNAGILIKANGDIEINGNVKINGVVQSGGT